MSENRKKVILSVVGLALLVVFVVGITYAAFTFTSKGSKLNTIRTAKISMSYTEGENGISIVDAYPMSDEEGMVLSGDNQVFLFTVSADIPGKGTNIGYEVTAEKQESSTLNDTDVKLYLERSIDNTNFSAVDEASNYVGLSEGDAFGAKTGEMVMDTNIVNKTSTIYYKLRMWVDEEYEASGESKSFTVKVNVYGSDSAMNSKSYNVFIKTNKTTSSEESIRVGYNSTGSVTLTPNDGYYLSEVRCTNGYTVNANIGASVTTPQEVTINNNGNTGKGVCTVVSNPVCMSNKTADACSAGTEVSYRVNDSIVQDFYVLKDEGNALTLITDKVVATGVSWNSSGDNSGGPVTATEALENATSSWTNVPSNTYDGSSGQATRARLITLVEAETVGCKSSKNSCPIWLTDSSYYHWTSTPNSNNSEVALVVGDSSYGGVYGNDVARVIVSGGVRAVVTISK